MKRFMAGLALLLTASAMTAACAKHDEDSANLTTTNTVVTDESVTNGVDDNLSAIDASSNAGAVAPGNGS